MFFSLCAYEIHISYYHIVVTVLLLMLSLSWRWNEINHMDWLFFQAYWNLIILGFKKKFGSLSIPEGNKPPSCQKLYVDPCFYFQQIWHKKPQNQCDHSIKVNLYKRFVVPLILISVESAYVILEHFLSPSTFKNFCL